MIGKYIAGQNKAHTCCCQHTPVFNCQMYGTFNVYVEGLILTDLEPSIITKNNRYWFLKLTKGSQEVFGWCVRGFFSKQKERVIEVVTKKLIPENFKTGNIEVTFFNKWDETTVKKWAGKQYWFQTFPFSPSKRADSELVWDTIKHINWSGKEVLDIGSHYGYFSFKASELGSNVVGFEPNINSLNNAKIIRDFIIQQDISFVKNQPEGMFDVTLYLSVHHQLDPNYHELKNTLEKLKSKTREVLFVELIIPPSFPKDKKMTESQIDEIVGGKVLLKYSHKVRCIRKIYKIDKNA
jgi:hypothetical protein